MWLERAVKALDIFKGASLLEMLLMNRCGVPCCDMENLIHVQDQISQKDAEKLFLRRFAIPSPSKQKCQPTP